MKCMEEQVTSEQSNKGSSQPSETIIFYIVTLFKKKIIHTNIVLHR